MYEIQRPHDRPDLLVHVFRLKVKCLMQTIKAACLGSVDVWLYSIDFQKGELPQKHILIWLSNDSKIHPCMIQNVDGTVSVEIPDEDQHPELYEIVTSHIWSP